MASLDPRPPASRPELLGRLGRTGLDGRDLAALLNAAADALARGLPADAVHLLRPDLTGSELVLHAAAGWSRRSGDPLRVPLEDGSPAARALSSRDAVVMDDLSLEAPFPGGSRLAACGVRALAYRVVPGRDRPYGVLAAHVRSPRSFDGADLAFLSAVAEIVAQVVEVHQAREQLLLIDGVRDHAMFRLDPTGAVLTWSAAAERVTGYQPAEIVGRHVGCLYLAWDAKAGKPERQLATAAREGRLDATEWWRRKDGFRFRADVRIVAVRGPNGEVDGYYEIVRDLTDPRLQLQHQLAQSQKLEAVGELAGGVAHDFNNLLSVILGYVEILLEEVPPDSALRGDLEGISRAVDRAATLVHQLLAFSRRQVLQPVVFDLNETLRGLQSMLRRLIGEDVVLVVRTSAEPAPIRADSSQIEQVVVNLAINARDAMPHGGTITIETAITGPRLGDAAPRPGGDLRVMLKVTDTGTGMDEDTLTHCFEPFFTTKDPGRGTGLGLATVYGVVRQSGGEVFAASVPGSGTTFVAQFPLVDADPQDLPAPERPGTAPGKETVLLVEDEDEVRSLARRALGRSGYRVLEAANGVEALAVVGADPGPIDVLVTDVVMPRLGGVELAEQLARQGSVRCVLFISGYLDRASGDGGPSGTGAIDPDKLLPKPFRAEDLLSRVRQALDC
jgi:PAS domain S-box-containing protein